MTTTFNPLPAPGDIVWCHFPQSIGKPGPKPRPALVLACAPTTHEIMVAYGTSQKTDPHSIYPGEFVMDPQDAGFSVSGLTYRTKFNLADRVKIPFDSNWFEPAPGLDAATPLPKMGIMHPSYFKAAKKAQDQVLPVKSTGTK
jgi:hypothetical protein